MVGCWSPKPRMGVRLTSPLPENRKLVAYKSSDYVSEKHTGEAVIYSTKVTVAIQGESTQVP